MKKIVIGFLAILLSITLAGCFGNSKKQPSKNESKVETVQKESSSQANKDTTVKKQPSESESKVESLEATESSEATNVTSSAPESNPQNEANEDWKKNFEEVLYGNYQVTVKRYVDNGDGTYGVFVNEIDTGDHAYVTVNSATGNFHG